MTKTAAGAPAKVPVDSPADEPQLARPLLITAIVCYTLVGGLSALFEVLLVPLYVGGTIFPLAVLIALVGNIMLPRLLRGVVNSALIAALPIMLWVIVVLVLGFTPMPAGDVLLPGYGKGQYVGEGVLLVGLFAGVLSVFIDNGRRRPRIRQDSVTAPSR
jgi:hypothetical protein